MDKTTETLARYVTSLRYEDLGLRAVREAKRAAIACHEVTRQERMMTSAFRRLRPIPTHSYYHIARIIPIFHLSATERRARAY